MEREKRRKKGEKFKSRGEEGWECEHPPIRRLSVQEIGVMKEGGRKSGVSTKH